ncbi:ABC transporter, substrate-binding protein (cluster 4, leucine/isoleucine/valine/benzoate) [hydrothermal vent metagenome]|uniref:ABC transporter, substrate-binding protein (Cluster 4, leucine/isoleucine/valine/benzoate) n=1 Tax=hydrothermal vent metagenome TaxID=652676 RepID=A0A3B1CE13_9ZZZZ
MNYLLQIGISLFFILLVPDAGFSNEKPPLRFGMTTALSGPASDLGLSMKRGIETYFDHINKQGGINGRPLNLLALDDGYQPTSAAANMRRLAQDQEVLAIIGNMGTPTAMVTVPIANREKVLLFGAFTGANILRKTPPDRYIINLRASYEEETAAMINGMLNRGINPDEIAFFTQNDAYGDAGYAGAIKALQSHGYQEAGHLPHGRYTRNTLDVEDGLLKLLDAARVPKAIIIVGTYSASAKFIKYAKTIWPNTRFLNISFVGSIPLAKALGKAGKDVGVTQVVPHFESTLPGVTEYRRLLKIYDPEASPDFVSLEGFIAAKILVAGLKRAPKKITRENLIDAIESIQNLDIGIGVPISYSKKEHQALHRVWETEIRNQQFVPLNEKDTGD